MDVVAVVANPYIPQSFLFQWHITSRCNLRCSHCYQDDFSGKDLPFDKLLVILDQYRQLLRFWRKNSTGTPPLGRITITGGEPFLREDLPDLLKAIAKQKECSSVAILTNGSLLDADTVKWLRKLKPAFVQVSLEGAQPTHDKIRGQGNFEKVVSAIKHLVTARIRTVVSFTAQRRNYRESQYPPFLKKHARFFHWLHN